MAGKTYYLVATRTSRPRLHTDRGCQYIQNAEREIRETTRRQHPNKPVCAVCEGGISRGGQEQRHLAAKIKRAHAGD